MTTAKRDLFSYHMLPKSCSYFGKVENGQLKLNEAGFMVENLYWELENKYDDIRANLDVDCTELVFNKVFAILYQNLKIIPSVDFTSEK